MISYYMRRHPVITVLTLMVIGPYLLAAALLVFLLYVALELLSLAFTK